MCPLSSWGEGEEGDKNVRTSPAQLCVCQLRITIPSHSLRFTPGDFSVKKSEGGEEKKQARCLLTGGEAQSGGSNAPR